MEIKFRGYSLNENKWLYGNLLLINDKAYIYPYSTGDLNDIDFGFSFEEVDIKSIGQFTGLCDGNNKEIYNGDIDQYGYTVVYSNGMDDNRGIEVGWFLQRNNWESYMSLIHDEDLEIKNNVYFKNMKSNKGDI